jgi:hypothetical protein
MVLRVLSPRPSQKKKRKKKLWDSPPLREKRDRYCSIPHEKEKGRRGEQGLTFTKLEDEVDFSATLGTLDVCRSNKSDDVLVLDFLLFNPIAPPHTPDTSASFTI